MVNTKLPTVKSKFNALVKEVYALRQALQEAEERVNDLEMKIATKNDEITGLHTELRNRNIADAVVGQNKNTSGEAKQKITELMREIDRCIALLNV